MRGAATPSRRWRRDDNGYSPGPGKAWRDLLQYRGACTCTAGVATRSRRGLGCVQNYSELVSPGTSTEGPPMIAAIYAPQSNKPEGQVLTLPSGGGAGRANGLRFSSAIHA